jgi:hypothetical protein
MLTRKQMKTRLILASLALGYMAGGSAAHAQLTITPTFDSSITSLPDATTIEASINTDISTLESYVTTPNPDNVTIDFKNINTGLGQSLTPQADLDYSSYLSGLQANPSKNANQQTALANMPAGPSTGINNATQVYLTAANLAAIGQATLASSLVAGNGGFNSVISLNFSQLNDSRPDANSSLYDLQSVAAHEIDEVLGIGGNASQLYQSGATAPSSLPTDVGPLDFFRYSAPGVMNFTYDPSATAYFSINGGVTQLVNFNQQGAGGSDFGDWGNANSPQTRQGNTPPQVQDAFGTPGGMANLGGNELTGLTVEGYNLTPAGLAVDGLSSVPEPATIISGAMLLLPFGSGAFRQLRKKFPAA